MSYSNGTITQVTQMGWVNAYLVRETDGLTLIDGLQGNQTKRILATAASLGAPIVRIVLTHSHPDHIGSIDALLAALPDAEFIVSAREARVLTQAPELEPGEAAGGKLLKKGAGISSVPDRLVADGDTIGSLLVVAAPGHAIGQVAFLDTRDQTLICGDAYSTLAGVATTAKLNWKFPFPALASWHRPTALESARRLRALNPARLAPGHGPVVEAPGAAMDRAIAKAS